MVETVVASDAADAIAADGADGDDTIEVIPNGPFVVISILVLQFCYHMTNGLCITNIQKNKPGNNSRLTNKFT
jgi:hypothetical protein